MFITLAKFLWDHFWKLISFGVTTGFIWFVASVQAPATVEARISTLESKYVNLNSDNENLKIGLGVNNNLFMRVDNKLDDMNKSIIRLSEQLRRDKP